nr:unnamed protein product [Callosobruchus chinensis]
MADEEEKEEIYSSSSEELDENTVTRRKWTKKGKQSAEKQLEDLTVQVTNLTRLLAESQEAAKKNEEMRAMLAEVLANQKAPTKAKTLPMPEEMEVARTTSKRKKTSSSSDEERAEKSEEVPASKKKATSKATTHDPEVTGTVPTVGAGNNQQEDTAVETVKESRKEKRPPPLYIHREEQWQEVTKKKRLSCKNPAKLTRAGIKIQLDTKDEYRQARRTLEEQGVEHHTYSLPEDKPLSVVIRGIPRVSGEDEVKADLQEKGFHPIKVNRMTSRRSRKAIPLVKVDLPKEEVEVYKVQDCCQMKVTVEALRRKTGPGNVTGASSLVTASSAAEEQCAGAHRPSECQVPTNEPAKCANCGGPHPASYGGCPRRPSPTQRQGVSQKTQTRKAIMKPSPIREGHSYARVAQPQRDEQTRSQEETENQVLQQLLATEKRAS